MQNYVKYIRSKYKLVYGHIDLMCIAKLVKLVYRHIHLIFNARLI